MTDSPPVFTILIPLLMGMAVSALILHAWLWANRHGDPLAPWVTAWSSATLFVLAGHYIQITTADPGRAVVGARLSWSGAVLLLPITMGVAHGLVGHPVPRRRLLVVLPATALLIGLTVWTDLIMTGQTSFYGSLLHSPYFRIQPGPLMLPLALAVAGAFVYFWRTALGRAAGLPAAERRVLRAGVIVYTAFGINDVLNSARVIRTERLFDVAFVALTAALTYVLARRHDRLQTHLEEEVAARTRDVETRAVWLDALVSSGQVLMAGLDLETALRRIAAEAQRIAGSPHTKVLLLDPAAGVLRPGVADGELAPGRPEIPLGQGYSGTVALSGAPLCVADARAEGGLAPDATAPGERIGYLGLPIKKSGEVLGVLAIETVGGRAYTPDEIAYLGSFADQAAIAIDNARLFGSAKRRETRLTTLSTLTQSLTATLSLDEVLDRVVHHAVKLFGSSVSRLWLVEEGGATLALRAQAGGHTTVSGVTRMRVGEGIVGSVVATCRPAVIEDLERHHSRVNADRHRTEGLVSLGAVPLMLGDRAIGALAIALRERHRFDDEEIRLLQALANHAAIAAENARLYAEARGQAHELEALDEVRLALVSSLDTRAVLEAIAQWAVRLLGAQASAVYEANPQDELLHPRTVHATDPLQLVPLRPGQGIGGQAFSRREPAWAADVLAEPPPGFDEDAGGSGRSLRDVAREESFRGILAAPIISRESAFGAICIYWRAPHTPDAREMRLVRGLAQQAAVALDNARLYQALEQRLLRLETLTRLNRLISSSLDEATVLREIGRSAAELMSVPMAAVWIADETARALNLAGFSDLALESDFPFRTIAMDTGAIGWVATHRRPLHVPDVLAPGTALVSNEALPWWRAHELRSFYGVPVIHEGSLLAVLVLTGREPLRIDAAAEQQIAAFTSQVALAMTNAAAYEAEARARREAELALAQVKELQGLLPICAWCKKVRNDRNYWESIETYISQRSHATFSHGICPDCRTNVAIPDVARRQTGN